MANVSGTDSTEISEIVNDFIRYQLGRRGYEWLSCPPLPPPKKACVALRSLGDEFLVDYSEHVSEMCIRINLTPSLAHSAFHGVVNELFSEGITWSRIVAAFVFTSELTVLCMEKHWPDVVDNLAKWLASYVCTNLKTWIQEHHGWEGLVEFSEQRDGQKSDSPWPAFKNVVCGVAVTALGALTLGAILTSKS